MVKREARRRLRRSAKPSENRWRSARPDRSTSTCCSPSASTARPMSGSSTSSGSWTKTVRASLCAVISVRCRLLVASAPETSEIRHTSQSWLASRAARRSTSFNSAGSAGGPFAVSRRFVPHGRGQNAPHAGLACFRPDLIEPMFGKHDCPHPIAERRNAEGRQGGGFRSDHRLHGTLAAEEHGLALVHQQQHVAVALFGVDAGPAVRRGAQWLASRWCACRRLRNNAAAPRIRGHGRAGARHAGPSAANAPAGAAES